MGSRRGPAGLGGGEVPAPQLRVQGLPASLARMFRGRYPVPGFLVSGLEDPAGS